MSKAVGAIAFVGAIGAAYYLWRENERQKAGFDMEREALYYEAQWQAEQRRLAEQQPQQNPWAPVIEWGLGEIMNRGNTNNTTTGKGLGGLLDGLFGRNKAKSGAGASRNGAQAGGSAGAEFSGMGPGGVDFGAHERRYGLPGGYLERTAQIESAMNPSAKNPNSSAGGLFQFINSTAREYGLVDRYDPVESTDAASRLARDNANYLRRKLGREPTAAELYLAHQQGAGGAARLLADPNRRASEVVGADAVRLNGGNANMTSGQFADKWLDKFNAGYV